MPRDNYILFEIAGRTFDLDPASSIPTIDYALEDEQDFEVKSAAIATDISLVPTLATQQGLNTAHDPSVQDNTPLSDFDRPLPARYVANGYELLTGKFFLQSTIKKNGRVEKYTGKIYGLNGDWVIELKEKTLYDFLNPIQHTFELAAIVNSWIFDGRSEQQDYVYAPARYLKPFGDYPPASDDPDAPTRPDDTNVLINDLKPSLSIYWLLYRGFKAAGYRIVSTFMDTDYYRRSVLPWTWGGFDYLDDTRWEPLKFLAKAVALRIENDYDGFPDFGVVDNVPGAYDNSDTYQWTGPNSSLPNAMVWTFKPIVPGLGKTRVNLSVQVSIDYKVQPQAEVVARAYWYKNGAEVAMHELLYARATPNDPGAKQGVEFKEDFYEGDVVPGDYIACRIFIGSTKDSLFGFARITTTIEQFTLNFMKLTEGATISLANYPKFKNYKWLDLLRGEIDLFDLSIQTDPVRKEVIIEPRHDYMLNNEQHSGYFNRKQLDFSQKQDISRESTLEIVSDYEREFVLKFRDDSQDGGLKKVQDRNQTTVGFAKYVLPERFKAGKKELENRFYSPPMHYEHDSWRYITGVAPQLPVIIPENVANTSSEAAENTFQPKRAWYKGNISGVGGWKFNNQLYTTFPYMFAVNYKAGGEQDPVLSYADQQIGGTVAHGLLKKFYWQRLAILRKGRRYNGLWLRLNNSDATNFLHRESIVIEDMEYLLTHLKGYNPLSDESTQVVLWLFENVNGQDNLNTYPSLAAVRDGAASGSLDVKYWHHKVLNSDIPK